MEDILPMWFSLFPLHAAKLMIILILQLTGIRSHTICMLVNNTPGVLNLISGVISRRGYNVQVAFVHNSCCFLYNFYSS